MSLVLGRGDYPSGTAGLIAAIQDLSRARTVDDVYGIVRASARRITGSDGSSIAVREGAQCRYVAHEGVGSSLPSGRMQLEDCLPGWVVLHRRPALVPEVRADQRVRPDGYYGPSLATSVLAVPIRTLDPVGALAIYWLGRHAPTEDEVTVLQALADSTSVALENAAVRVDLEARVRDRTAMLEELNSRLQLEIAERKRAEEEVRQLSLSDELTGLYNRRGFMLLAGRELKMLQRTGRRALVLYIDLDGLKQANDSFGHDAGDRLLGRAAKVLRSVARETDVVGRIGGDEFAVFMSLGFDHPPLHRIVERFIESARAAGVRWSVGATASLPERVVALEDLLAGADEAMYRGRRARRGERAVGAGSGAGAMAPRAIQPVR